MSDRRPLVFALTVGALALSANGAALLIAVSPAAPPQAAAFGIIGLTAAFIGLITTILWACRRDEPKPQKKRGRVFTPWVPPADDGEAYLLPEPGRHSALALAAAPRASMTSPAPAPPAPVAAPVAAPVKTEAQVINLQDWLKAHRPQHVLA
ncbi:MAG TPA: hypothetical protein VKV32_13695 [Stellaceae bacterium]|nr:hypothetical protein [Stellaceae bacterium]